MSRTLSVAQITEILALHRQWRITDGREGARADLAGADLAGARLAGARLTGADLAGAVLTKADLTNAVLTLARLAGADLAGARLAFARLTGADLEGARLAGADLTGAFLTGANITDAVLGRTLQRIGPIGGWAMIAVRWDDGPRIACGCRWFTRADAENHWGPGCADRREHGDIMLAGLRALLATCRAHGWPGCEEDHPW